ncbi:hypothetical protein DB346_12295 [Verrucomicrobia bacterium LW23]|nr:hypothetical protein DB346_12295 [Verrucomicrobia bacterium LW23]
MDSTSTASPQGNTFADHAAHAALDTQRFENQGDQYADSLLREARAHVYHWSADFPGFEASLILLDGAERHYGDLRVRSSRDITLGCPGAPEEAAAWARSQLEELVAHRESPDVSKMASKAGVTRGDLHAVYGTRVTFTGDRMESYYRIADHKIVEIGRAYGKMRFVIHIDEHQECDNRYAASHYTVFYFDRATDALTKVETYLDRYTRVGDYFLPAERRYTEAAAGKLHTRALLLQGTRLITPA